MDRLNHTLWLLMEFDIHRYLISNAEGRESGIEKATCHMNLCNQYLASVFGCDIENARSLHDQEFEVIHEETQELTGYMDEVIGFPLKGVPAYEILAPKFFKEFIRLADKAMNKMREAEDD